MTLRNIHQYIRQPSVLLAAFLLLLGYGLCGCGGGSGSIQGDGTSGTRGTVTVYSGPVGVAPPSGTTFTPLPGAIVVAQQPDASQNPLLLISVSYKTVAQTQADAQGNYSLALTPGSYRIGVSQTGQAGSQPLSYVSVAVQAHQYTAADIHFNSNTQ